MISLLSIMFVYAIADRFSLCVLFCVHYTGCLVIVRMRFLTAVFEPIATLSWQPDSKWSEKKTRLKTVDAHHNKPE